VATPDAAAALDQTAADSSSCGVQAHVLNPKSISLAELYGSYNPVTNEWTDGLASRMIRATVADACPNMHWVVFDGPVDAGWVESMNTGKQYNCQISKALTLSGLVKPVPAAVICIGAQEQSRTDMHAQVQCIRNVSGRGLAATLQQPST